MLGNRLACVKRPPQAGGDQLHDAYRPIRPAGGTKRPMPAMPEAPARAASAARSTVIPPMASTERPPLHGTSHAARRGSRADAPHLSTRSDTACRRSDSRRSPPARHHGSLIRTMHRPADEAPSPSSDRIAVAAMESPRRCTPCAPAASATSARSLTSTFVLVPSGRCDAARHERDQPARVEIALANLNQIDARARCRCHEIDEPIGRVFPGREPPAIGHEADHDCSIVSIVSMRRRASSTDASSLNPISRLTTPRPDTAPRR